MTQLATHLATEVEGVVAPPEGVYDLDITHTSVEFVARHMLSKVRGRFTDFSGTVTVGSSPQDSSVEVEIKAESIQTNTEQRDQHLKSGDFLEIEEFPTLTFTSTAVRQLEGPVFQLDGELTIKGITQPVTLEGTYLGLSTNPYGMTVLAATARTSIEREDWDMTWNVAIETGGWLVSKKIDLEIEVEAILREPEQA